VSRHVLRKAFFKIYYAAVAISFLRSQLVGTFIFNVNCNYRPYRTVRKLLSAVVSSANSSIGCFLLLFLFLFLLLLMLMTVIYYILLQKHMLLAILN